MGTPEAQIQALAQELIALRQEMDRQRQEQQQELARVQQESAQRLQEVTQAAVTAQGNLQMVPAAIQEMGQVLRTAMRDQNKELVEVMKDSKGSNKLCLVDTKGFGKPSTFSGEPEQFLPWRHRMTSYICSVYPDMREVLEWCEEREKSISSEELSNAFGEKADVIDQIEGLEEKSRELASALQMVTLKAPFAIVVNCGTGGLEAWRRLSRRYDPATASRKRTMLKAVISPQKQKLEMLPQAIEEWLDAVRTYEKRRDGTGQRTTISDEIKMAALEAMLPPDLEAHVQLNQSRFKTFDELLEEITRFVEHKTGKTLKMVSAASALANQSPLGDPMDVSSVGYMGAGAKGKATKFLGACHHCGKTGHKAADCWAKNGKGSGAKGTPGKGPGSNNANKGKSKGGKSYSKGGKAKGSKGSKGKGPKGKGTGTKGKAKGVNNVESGTQAQGEAETGEWQEEWAEDGNWETEWAEESQWQESNGLLLGGLEVDEPKTPKNKADPKVKAKTTPKPKTLASASSAPFDVNNLSDAEASALMAALQARAKARLSMPPGVPVPKLPPPPKPRTSRDASSQARSTGSGMASGSTRPPEPMKPPPQARADGLKRPPEPKVPPKQGPLMRPPPRAGTTEPKAKAKPKPMPQKALTVMGMLKTRSEWGRMRFRERWSHQQKLKKYLPRGSMGQFILKKQGAPCSTCTVRRKISTKAARAYIAAKAAKAGRGVSQPKAGPSGLARRVLKREGLLKNPGERKESRVAKAKKKVKEEEEDIADPSEGGESVEPEGSEKGESEAPETDEEVEEIKEEETKETIEEDLEEVLEEVPESSSHGTGSGSASSGQTGVSPVAAKSSSSGQMGV